METRKKNTKTKSGQNKIADCDTSGFGKYFWED